MVTGVQVKVGMSPRILGRTVQVSAGFPVTDVGIGRFGHQRLEALFTGGVTEIVHAIEVEGVLDPSQVRLHSRDLGVVDASDDIRCDDRREDDEEDHNYHDLDQGKPALSASAGLGSLHCNYSGYF